MDVGMGVGNQLRSARGDEMQAAMAKPVSYGEQIAQELKQAETRVTELKRIQEILAGNPEFEELLTLVGRRRY